MISPPAGLPKGTMLSHFNLTANLLQSYELLAQENRAAGGKVLSPLPMFHIYAFMVRVTHANDCDLWRPSNATTSARSLCV